MALSDYLTGDEWDACFYAFVGGKHGTSNFGESMHEMIRALLDSGYEFEGLDENGDKDHQVEDGVNAPKVCIFVGNPHNCDVVRILDNGRNFLKKHMPSMVDETDEEWAEDMRKAREEAEASQ